MGDQAEVANEARFWPVPADLAGIRLDSFVRRCLPHLSRRSIVSLLAEKYFSVNGRVAKKGDHLSGADRVEFIGPIIFLATAPPSATELDVPVVHEDESILLLDKPAGVATHGFSGRDADTLANFLAARRPELLNIGKSRWEPGLVHRLDGETSGLVLIAKSQAAFDDLRGQFRRREVSKIYWALVWGKVDGEGTIELPLAHDSLDRRRMIAVTNPSPHQQSRLWRAVTGYRTLGQAPSVSLLEIDMATGVTHQIRVHLAAIGHPIVGDQLYGTDPPGSFALERHFLHARSLGFRHPADGRTVQFTAELPADLREVLRRIRLTV